MAAFVEALGVAARRGGWAVHACVVMANHYRLVVSEAPGAGRMARL